MCVNTAAERFDERLYDAQPETGAGLGTAPVAAVEHVPDERQFLRCDADAGIGDTHSGRFAVALSRHLDGPAVLRVLERVVQQVRDGSPLSPHNRWAGAKALRQRWHAAIEASLCRPVLLVDEAQEMAPSVLNELRLLASTDMDSRQILTVVLCGDGRLADKLRQSELLPVATRIRTRLHLEPASSEELLVCLKHVLAQAGSPRLMTAELMTVLCDHALGTPRTLMNLADELLAAAMQRQLDRIDEKLFFEVHGHAIPGPARPRKAAAR